MTTAILAAIVVLWAFVFYALRKANRIDRLAEARRRLPLYDAITAQHGPTLVAEVEAWLESAS